MSWETVLADISRISPIASLCATALVVMAVDWFLSQKQSRHVGIVTLVGLVVTLVALAGTTAKSGAVSTVFAGRLVVDRLGDFFTWFFVLCALATVLVSLRTRAYAGRRMGEYFSLLTLATAAMAVVAASRDFLILYLAIETVSLPSYVLVGWPRGDRLSTEASLKYVLYGGVASGLMLFGISYIYGMTGTTVIPQMYESGSVSPIGLAIALILLLAGLGFKMAVVPFHSWSPDVYEGAPTPITAYLSVASKGAGFAAVLRIMYPLFCMTETGREIPKVIQSINPWVVLWLISAVTMTFGNLVAIWQKNVKRLLAYSSIAHAGYMAMAFTLSTREAFEAVIIYLMVYFVMNLGAFFTVLFIENATSRCDLDCYKGLIRRSPLLVTVLTIFLLSLLGIPPTAGFMAKFKMFGALIKEGSRPSVWLAIIGIINAVISAYYYMKVVKAMVFDRGEEETPIRTPALDGAVLVVFAAAIFALFIMWTPVQRIAGSIPLDLTSF